MDTVGDSVRRSFDEVRIGYSLPCQFYEPDQWFGGEESVEPTKTPRSQVNAIMKFAAEECWDSCPLEVRRACLRLGLVGEDVRHGVWGGWLPKQRERIIHLLDVLAGKK